MLFAFAQISRGAEQSGKRAQGAGRLDEAKSAYAEALRLNPGLAMVYNNMGQALQEESRIDEAMTWYRRAIELEPDTARYHANLASGIEAQEKHDDAVACYEIALRLDPGHAESCNGLGWIRHKQGRYDERSLITKSAATRPLSRGRPLQSRHPPGRAERLRWG